MVAFWAKSSIVSSLSPTFWAAHKAGIVSIMFLAVKIYFHLQVYSIVCPSKTKRGFGQKGGQRSFKVGRKRVILT